MCTFHHLARSVHRAETARQGRIDSKVGTLEVRVVFAVVAIRTAMIGLAAGAVYKAAFAADLDQGKTARAQGIRPGAHLAAVVAARRTHR